MDLKLHSGGQDSYLTSSDEALLVMSNVLDPSPTLDSKDSFTIVDTQKPFLPPGGPETIPEATYQTEQTSTSLPGHVEL